MPPRRGLTRIGTSGFSYRDWRGILYPAGTPARRWLETYAASFDTVELNGTFYRLPAGSVFSSWRERTPEGFLFALKGSRYITHILRLAGAGEALSLFLSRASLLGEKKGPVLFQLPPGMKADAGLLRDFLPLLPRGDRFAFEFRGPDWYNEGVFRVLREMGVGLCVHDLSGEPTPRVLTADWTYLRFHGTAGRYAGRYGKERLQPWAREIRAWRKKGVDVFAYFNNDVGGDAVHDARELREMCRD